MKSYCPNGGMYDEVSGCACQDFDLEAEEAEE